MLNLNYELRDHIKSTEKYQVLTLKLVKEDGTELNIPLVMPHLLDKEDIEKSTISDIQISLPLDMPDDCSFGELGDEKEQV